MGNGSANWHYLSILAVSLQLVSTSWAQEKTSAQQQQSSHDSKEKLNNLWQDLEKFEDQEYQNAESSEAYQEGVESLFNSIETYFTFDELESQHTPLIVMSGGFNSCSNGNPLLQGMAPQFFKLYQDAEKTCKCKPQWVLACQDLDSHPWVVSSLNPQSKPQIMTEKSLVKLVTEMSQPKSGKMSVYLIGHSHGGWRVMGLAKSMQNLKNTRLLLTLDPISKNDCGIIEGASSLIGLGGAACRRAPLEYQDIQRTVRWTNIYQTAGFLHSGPVKTAHATNVSFGPYGHTRIDNAEKAWEYFGRQIH